jgi:hypothetical protein
VLGELFLVYDLKKTSELQDCVMQGAATAHPWILTTELAQKALKV